MSEFQSPLLLAAPPAIDFGVVAQGPDVTRVRWEMNAYLFRLADDLPAPLADEARQILRRYCGGDGDFFRLFYVPIWSFLHWVTPGMSDLARLAREAHALSLFLHLWDDHLCDGQLAPDLLRLQLRTLAWSRFTACAGRLCQAAGADPGLVAAHTAEYLVSLHRPEPVADLAAYCQRFTAQMRICTLVPLLVGGDALCRVVTEFGIAWRLLDDLQDREVDATVGKESAVSVERGCTDRLVSAIHGHLASAASMALASGWAEMARELAECRETPRVPPRADRLRAELSPADSR